MFCQDELAREVRVSKDNVAVNMKKWYLKNYEARFPHIKQDMEVMTYAYIRKYCTTFSGGIPYSLGSLHLDALFVLLQLQLNKCIYGFQIINTVQHNWTTDCSQCRSTLCIVIIVARSNFLWNGSFKFYDFIFKIITQNLSPSLKTLI